MVVHSVYNIISLESQHKDELALISKSCNDHGECKDYEKPLLDKIVLV